MINHFPKINITTKYLDMVGLATEQIAAIINSSIFQHFSYSVNVCVASQKLHNANKAECNAIVANMPCGR